VQRRVVEVISAYDDLIENNRRRMALLEEAARQLYREWFVRLRFPGHEHTRITYGVSEGWERRTVRDVAEVNQESLSSSFDGEIEYVDISSVTPGQINETAAYDFHDAPSRARRVVRHGDIVWSCVRPNRRSHAVIWHPQSNLIVSTGFAVLTPRTVPTAFLYFATTTDAFVGYLENHARGAAYPAVVAGDFERAELLVPSRTLLASFNDFVEPTLSQIHGLRVQNQKLRAARDLLLPRLMSGEIAV
jgi:type I restriction enzyme S subunit